MALESEDASRPQLSCGKYQPLLVRFFVCVLTKRDMELKIGQKALLFSFVDLSGCGSRGEDRQSVRFF